MSAKRRTFAQELLLAVAPTIAPAVVAELLPPAARFAQHCLKLLAPPAPPPRRPKR